MAAITVLDVRADRPEAEGPVLGNSHGSYSEYYSC